MLESLVAHRSLAFAAVTTLALASASPVFAQSCEPLAKSFSAAARAVRESAHERLLQRRAEAASSPIRGNPAAPITLTVYGDFDCPNTARMHAVIIELLQKHPSTLRLVFKVLPIPAHRFAMSAARQWAAVRLAAPDKTWPYFDGLFKGKLEKRLDASYVRQLDRQLGIDSAPLAAALQSPKIDAMVNADIGEARRLGIDSVPTFLLNGIQVESGTVPIEFLEADIAKIQGPAHP